MKIHSKNKKAKHDYEFIKSYEAGLKLLGPEVKSIKSNNVSLLGSYVSIDIIKNKIYLKQSKIEKPQNTNSFYRHEENRDIELLMNTKEITDLFKLSQEKGFSIIPYIIYTNEKSLIKIEIWSAKGKNNYDKRSSLKESDIKREMQRSSKESLKCF